MGQVRSACEEFHRDELTTSVALLAIADFALGDARGATVGHAANLGGAITGVLSAGEHASRAPLARLCGAGLPHRQAAAIAATRGTVTAGRGAARGIGTRGVAGALRLRGCANPASRIAADAARIAVLLTASDAPAGPGVVTAKRLVGMAAVVGTEERRRQGEEPDETLHGVFLGGSAHARATRGASGELGASAKKRRAAARASARRPALHKAKTRTAMRSCLSRPSGWPR